MKELLTPRNAAMGLGIIVVLAVLDHLFDTGLLKFFGDLIKGEAK